MVKRAVAFNPKVGENVMRTGSFIELFDSSLNLKATGIPVEEFGFLQGADSSGGIYFNSISKEDGIHVVKARLSLE